MKRREPMDEFAADLRDKQENTTWPKMMVNSGAIDRLLWKGDPKAPLVQRIGVVLVGAFLLEAGLLLMAGAFKRDSRLIAFFAFGILVIGLRVCRNGFRRH